MRFHASNASSKDNSSFRNQNGGGGIERGNKLKRDWRFKGTSEKRKTNNTNNHGTDKKKPKSGEDKVLCFGCGRKGHKCFVCPLKKYPDFNTENQVYHGVKLKKEKNEMRKVKIYYLGQLCWMVKVGSCSASK